MPIITETFTKGGVNFSKDVLGVNKTSNGDNLVATTHPVTGELFISVIDGAASPYFYLINNEATDSFASRTMKELLKTSSMENETLSSAYGVIERTITPYANLCNTERKKAEQALNTKLTEKVWNPACAFVAASFHQQGAIIVQATDCTVSAITKSGSVKILTPDRHVILQEQGKLKSLKERPEVSIAKGIKPKEVLANEFKIIQHNREKCYNQEGGIAVFNGEYSMVTSGCLHTSVIFGEELKNYSHIVMVSDGMTPDRNNIESAIEYIYKNGAHAHYMDNLVPHFQGRNPVPTDCTSVVIDLER